jgi:hypothetical protein
MVDLPDENVDGHLMFRAWGERSLENLAASASSLLDTVRAVQASKGQKPVADRVQKLGVVYAEEISRAAVWDYPLEELDGLLRLEIVATV